MKEIKLPTLSINKFSNSMEHPPNSLISTKSQALKTRPLSATRSFSNVQIVSGYHSVQNSETGKVYHLSKNTDGTGNHIMVSSNYGSGSSHP